MQMNFWVKEMLRTRSGVRCMELPCPVWVHPSPSTSTYSTTPEHSEFCTLGIFMEASSHRHDPSSQFPAPPHFQENEGLGLKLSSFSLWLGDPAPILKLAGSPPKVTSLEQRHFYHPGNSKGFKSCVRNWDQRPTIRIKDPLTALIS